MVSLSALWLPIMLSAVIVFVASSIMHMVLPYHRSDYQKLPDEAKVLAALRAAGLKRGLYMFPHATHKDMRSPRDGRKIQAGTGWHSDRLSHRPSCHAEIPRPVVRLLPHCRILRRLSRGPHAGARA